MRMTAVMRAGIWLTCLSCRKNGSFSLVLSVTKQLNVIKRFLHQAGEIIHAGDPDREGSFWLMKCWIISSFLPKSASRCGVV
ncbi:DNA topoisomerase III [Salmonella enterica subsp. enterica serovar Typhimurium]|nr:DNA topoisomerase III [Salmonella enterica subsp. enterica serovar Typhimurium]